MMSWLRYQKLQQQPQEQAFIQHLLWAMHCAKQGGHRYKQRESVPALKDLQSSRGKQTHGRKLYGVGRRKAPLNGGGMEASNPVGNEVAVGAPSLRWRLWEGFLTPPSSLLLEGTEGTDEAGVMRLLRSGRTIDFLLMRFLGARWSPVQKSVAQ